MNPSAAALAESVRRGEQSAEQIVTDCFARMAACDPLNGFVDRDDVAALETARSIDRRRVAGDELGALAGVPFATKSNICTERMSTDCCSAILDGHVSPYEATSVARLRGADAILVGKTNADEFAMGWDNSLSVHGGVGNPRHPEKVAGGSSGGSAAVVGSDCVPLALGSDTGGSVRVPAAFCGTIGFKPSYGAISRHGLVAFASSLDHVGIVTRTVADARLALSVCGGSDGLDATTRSEPIAPTGTSTSLSSAKIGRFRGEWMEPLDDDIRRAEQTFADRLRHVGAVIEPFEPKSGDSWLSAYVAIACAEAASNLARYDGERFGVSRKKPLADHRSKLFGSEVKRRLMIGHALLSADEEQGLYRRARAARHELTDEIDRAFERFDLLMLPTCASTPHSRTERLAPDFRGDRLTAFCNLGGYPAITLPLASGSTIGLQLVAARGEDDALLNWASFAEDLLTGRSS